MVCKDTCIKYRARKPQPTLGRYDAGQKRCQVCAIFIEWKGVQCPCCGHILRTKPRRYGQDALGYMIIK